jgi:hypothetical protein
MILRFLNTYLGTGATIELALQAFEISFWFWGTRSSSRGLPVFLLQSSLRVNV